MKNLCNSVDDSDRKKINTEINRYNADRAALTHADRAADRSAFLRAEELTTDRPNIVTVNHFLARHPWPPYGGLRHLIHNAKRNGFSTCIIRIGRRVLIDEHEFEKWIDAHRNKKKEAVPPSVPVVPARAFTLKDKNDD